MSLRFEVVARDPRIEIIKLFNTLNINQINLDGIIERSGKSKDVKKNILNLALGATWVKTPAP